MDYTDFIFINSSTKDGFTKINKEKIMGTKEYNFSFSIGPKGILISIILITLVLILI